MVFPLSASQSLGLTCWILYMVPKGKQFLRILAPEEGQEELGGTSEMAWGLSL